MGLSTLQRQLAFAKDKVDTLCLALAEVSMQAKLTDSDKLFLKTVRPVAQKWIQRKTRLQRRIDKAHGSKSPTPLERHSFNRRREFLRLNKTDPAAAMRYIMSF